MKNKVIFSSFLGHKKCP